MTGFSITSKENVKENINRILTEQIDYILFQCKAEPMDVHKSVHEIRKSIKRIRAILRLIREEIGYSSYYRENIFYRDINRSISDIRTYNVLVLTLKKLQSELSGTIPNEKFEPVIELISKKREEMKHRDSDLNILAGKVAEAKSRIPGLIIEQNGFEVYAAGIYRMYSQSRDYLSVAEKKTDLHLLHDMRKRMKYLQFQTEILRPIYPGPLKAYSKVLSEITEKLGVYHDLEILSEFLENMDPVIRPEIQEAIIKACEFRKSSLLPRIRQEASAAFIDKPKDFVNRLAEYWRIYNHQ